MKYKHYMFDLETLDLLPTACIIQIACIPFEFEGSGLFSQQQFCANVDSISCMTAGMTVGTATWDFWQAQPQETKDSVFEDTVGIQTALEDFREFILSNSSDGNPILWSHSTFDPPILQNASVKANRAIPVDFRNYRDIRTLEFLAGNPRISTKRFEPKHNALADCKSQILYVRELMKLVEPRN